MPITKPDPDYIRSSHSALVSAIKSAVSSEAPVRVNNLNSIGSVNLTQDIGIQRFKKA
jgi:hypothetical protein